MIKGSIYKKAECAKLQENVILYLIFRTISFSTNFVSLLNLKVIFKFIFKR